MEGSSKKKLEKYATRIVSKKCLKNLFASLQYFHKKRGVFKMAEYGKKILKADI